MPAIYMTMQQVQAMIAFNKEVIQMLEHEQADLKNTINILWQGADPLNTAMDSQTAFHCLNDAKDSMRKTKKKIKLLAGIQCALKESIR